MLCFAYQKKNHLNPYKSEEEKNRSNQFYLFLSFLFHILHHYAHTHTHTVTQYIQHLMCDGFYLFIYTFCCCCFCFVIFLCSCSLIEWFFRFEGILLRHLDSELRSLLSVESQSVTTRPTICFFRSFFHLFVSLFSLWHIHIFVRYRNVHAFLNIILCFHNVCARLWLI